MGPTPKTAPKPGNSDSILQAIGYRHSVYSLSDKSPISDDRLKEIVQNIILTIPSSFNAQTTRIVVLVRDDRMF